MSSTTIGLGLAAIGRPQYINVRQGADHNKSEAYYRANAFKMLDFAYEQGLRHFDTAPSYGKGEEFLQQWYDQNKPKKLSLSTKWGYTYVANWNLEYNGAHEIKEHTLDKLLEQWSVSKNLLPALKVYQIHSATFESGVLENKEVLQKLFEIKNRTGLKMGISASGSRQTEILEFVAQISIKDKPLFESFQVTYNILEASTHKVLEGLIKSGRMVIVKEALANGRVFRNEDYKHYSRLYKDLESLAKKYGVSEDAVALRFIIDHLGPDVILSGASTAAQLTENLKAMSFKLDYQELLSLKQHAVNPDSYWNERKMLIWN
ncbi:MAG: aldo/keto reductase [Flavobacteriales bacterium]|nr:aldo/keto reductase [Flavobacteriales bacterium]